ncbi:uncharacterized protein CXQ87_003283 [Candidozyma duobushaemuli]|uniref:Uncharacterized protein n=1 Tax=Candidozyma duobushaemuli TaxID=1231522 RepID=A0A2V1ADU7_9ASCO|nr:uncharacterized protein CXQ87_003283 [[Candida] duobushaemulonis]PVH15443.1 hypothetical protein CXQ87_003283 [[Candida] duobushaemulonis]
MPLLHKQWSADDVSQNPGPQHPERRARSASPTKQRPISQLDIGALYGSAPFHDDIASKISNGSLSPDQIRRLSRSPIAKKLHISSANYALPIPFKLQMPPKLSTRSAPPSPEPSRGRSAPCTKPSEKALPASPQRSPKRLVFTGSSYEPAESSESESELSFLKPATPRNHQQLWAIARSMIEEASNAGSSRASSTRSKRLPTLPKIRSSEDQPKIRPAEEPPTPTSPTSQKIRNTSRKPPPDLQSPMPVSVSKPHLDLVPPPPPPISLPTSTSAPILSPRKLDESSADSSFNAPRKLETRVVTEAPRRHPDARLSRGEIDVFPTTPDPFAASKKPENVEMFSQTPVEEASQEEPKSLPHSHAYHHNLNLGEDSYLKIYKRSFSDESKVSSVSSFSSVGDALNLNHESLRSIPRSMNAPLANLTVQSNGPTRGASITSSKSASSSSSWDSIQKSVDFSIRDSTSASERSSLSSKSVSSKSTRKISKELPPPPEELELEGDSLEERFEIPRELNITKKPSTATSVSIRDEQQTVSDPEVTGSEENEEEETDNNTSSLDDGNSGVGRGFSFPNDMSNITNSEEARKRLEQQRIMNTSISRKRINRSSKQIEIPNLDDLESLSSYKLSETRHNGVSFNDLQQVKADGSDKADASDIEPLGVPSSAAKQHFSEMYGDKDTSSSESDSSFEKTNFKPSKPLSSPPKSMPNSVSLGAIASRKSPIRHARHRSMYNFDFADIYNEPSPQNSISSGKQPNKHKASKSISEPLPAPKQTSASPQEADKALSEAAAEGQHDEENDQSLNIVVAEPPKKIQYAVDFKDASSCRKPESNLYNTDFENDYYNRSARSSEPERDGRPPSEHSQQISGSSQSKFSDSMVTARETISTAPTDTDSITIDLTKEDYNVCMIKRNDSTMSYRSIIEKRNGRPVEVVLVEEDEEQLPKAMPAREDRDDLSSIYSRYMNDWDRQRKPIRKNSTRSSVSQASEESWAKSETGFQVKPKDAIRKRDGHVRKATMPNLEQFRNNSMLGRSKSKRVQSTPKLSVRGEPIANGNYNRGNNYFDYNGTENYDFESFMKQRL